MTKKRFLSLSHLYTELPKVFSVDNPRPLKIGIHQDIAEHFNGEFASDEITKVLTAYTTRKKYQQSLLKIGSRFDLNGMENGAVSIDERNFASRNLYVQMLNSPEGRVIRRERAKRNKELLLQYEAANELKKVSICEFAASIGMKDGACESMIYWARKDRENCLNDRLKLVAQFNESGLDAQDFCKIHSCKPDKLEYALKKVAAHLKSQKENMLVTSR